MDFLGSDALFSFLNKNGENSKLCLLIRHGERRHITPADKDFGAHVTLTEKGRAEAFNLGVSAYEHLGSRYFEQMNFYSSPVERCVETALKIGDGILGCKNEAGQVDVQKLNCLGDYFVCNRGEYEKSLHEGFYPALCQYAAEGVHPAFYPLASRAEEMRQMILEKSTAYFNVFVSHDAWIVPMLSHFCGLSFTPKRWMNFLTGILFEKKLSGKEKIYAITGMDSGWLNF
ncbi:MAG: histidine phosphatase family protein [Fibrobacteraceae bacterium]|nr:histidine phosphatase family protein [Fibrobacteraceae bacterium]